MDPQTHWEAIFRSKTADQMSWHQTQPAVSLAMIQRSGLPKAGRIIDVGSGTSVLIKTLLAENYQHVTILDISETALTVARQQLAEQASMVEWVCGDVRTVALPIHAFDVWHDRAVFHFFTADEDRAAYIRTLRNTLVAGGQLIIAMFADDGPEACSGLPVMRYSPELLTETLGAGFELLESTRQVHLTPWNSEQRFIHCRYQLV